MQIVHVTASALFGGPERQMIGLAKALPSSIRSSFLTFSEEGRCQAFLAALERAGLPGHSLVHDTPRLRASIREIEVVCRTNHADLIISHGYKSNLLARPVARRLGIPIVSVSRGWTGENLKVSCYDLVDRFHLRWMDRVVCVSQAQARKVYRSGVPQSRIRVIRNAARLEAFEHPDRSDRDELNRLVGAGPIVLAAGRLSVEKGFSVLVEAVALMKTPGVRVAVFGEGPERAGIEQRLRDLQIADRVHLLGHRLDLDRFLPWADLVVLPSFTEGLPNVPLEAAAAGRPVVATAVGGTPEVVIHNETGLLIPPGQPAEMALAMDRILGDRLLQDRLGQAARDYVIENFSFAAQAKAYLQLFDELLPAYSGMEPACV